MKFDNFIIILKLLLLSIKIHISHSVDLKDIKKSNSLTNFSTNSKDFLNIDYNHEKSQVLTHTNLNSELDEEYSLINNDKIDLIFNRRKKTEVMNFINKFKNNDIFSMIALPKGLYSYYSQKNYNDRISKMSKISDNNTSSYIKTIKPVTSYMNFIQLLSETEEREGNKSHKNNNENGRDDFEESLSVYKSKISKSELINRQVSKSQIRSIKMYISSNDLCNVFVNDTVTYSDNVDNNYVEHMILHNNGDGILPKGVFSNDVEIDFFSFNKKLNVYNVFFENKLVKRANLGLRKNYIEDKYNANNSNSTSDLSKNISHYSTNINQNITSLFLNSSEDISILNIENQGHLNKNFTIEYDFLALNLVNTLDNSKIKDEKDLNNSIEDKKDKVNSFIWKIWNQNIRSSDVQSIQIELFFDLEKNNNSNKDLENSDYNIENDLTFKFNLPFTKEIYEINLEENSNSIGKHKFNEKKL